MSGWARVNCNSEAQFLRSRHRYLHISAQLVRVPHYSDSGALLHVSIVPVKPGVTYRRPRRLA